MGKSIEPATGEAAMSKPNPFEIKGPTLISLSGGLTSGYMLHRYLNFYGGDLPDDCFVTFANTGKERHATYRFVEDMASHWGVKVHWLEWRPKTRGMAIADRFAEVGPNSADREGKLFSDLVKRKKYLPNPLKRYCTIELKIRVMSDFMRSRGFDHWNNAVGLRADEMQRVFKSIARNESNKERFKTIVPLANAKIRLEDVKAFWAAQPFTLDLEPHEGNCDLCFLKGRDKRAHIIRAKHGLADWWIAEEEKPRPTKPDGARFRKDETYRQLRDATLASPLFSFEPDSDEFDAECGLWCGGDD